MGTPFLIPGNAITPRLNPSFDVYRQRLTTAYNQKLGFGGGTYWLKAPLTCYVDMRPDIAKNEDLPHRGMGVVVTRLDCSAWFLTRPIRAWPGPQGNREPWNPIWREINEQ